MLNGKKIKIGEMSEVVRGSSPRPQGDPRYYGGNVPRLMVSDLTRDGMYVTPSIDFLTEDGAKLSRPMKKDDVVIAVSGNPGLPAILLTDACIHDGFVGLRNLDKKIIDKEYLFYFLLYNKDQTNSKAVGAIFKNLTTDQIKEIAIPLPDLKTQQEIAHVLEQADKARQQRKAANALTDQFLQSSFLSLFGDPVKNEKGWDVKTLEQLSEEIIDCPHSTPAYPGGITDFASIRTTELKDGFIDWSAMKYVTEETFNERNRRLVPQEGDIIFAREGNFGEAARIPKGVKICLGQRVMLFRAKKGICTSEFLWKLIRSNGIYQQALAKTSGSTVSHINVKDIKQFKGYCPPLSLQQQFADIVAQAEQLRQKQRESERELEQLFQSLLQRYFG